MVEEIKKCKKCNLEKNLEKDFRCKVINEKKYFEHICKKCRYDETIKKRNKDEFLILQRKKYFENKEEINKKRRSKYIPKIRKPKQTKVIKLQKIKKWQQNNPEKRQAAIDKYHKTHKEQEKEYRLKNKDNLNFKSKKYRSINKIKINVRLKLSRKKPLIKLRHNISSLIRFYMKKNGVLKNNKSSLQYLSYSILELKDHLEKQFEPWMNWNNWGNYNSETWDINNNSTWTWQLDHIIPQSTLPYTSMEDENFKKCWALDNLRPYSAKQNIVDGSTHKRHVRNK